MDAYRLARNAPRRTRRHGAEGLPGLPACMICFVAGPTLEQVIIDRANKEGMAIGEVARLLVLEGLESERTKRRNGETQ